jgi:parallel beta-helix repeat protein
LNNNYGIALCSSNNNTLTNNTVNLNNYRGIHLDSSSNNTIYNNYFNNTNNAYDNGNNTWNTTNTTGPNIIGGPYLGGNYWSDYSGNDTDGDGFGDTPYNITGDANKDYLPLLVPSGATLQGNVTFVGRGSNNTKWIEEFVVRFFDNGTKNETLWSSINATTNNTGFFNILGLTPGTYDVAIKSCSSVSEMVTNVTLNSTAVVDFGTIRVGDANGDDWVSSKDKAKLYKGWGSSEGMPGWNPNADFNNDGWLASMDKALLYKYWSEGGDLVGYF